MTSTVVEQSGVIEKAFQSHLENQKRWQNKETWKVCKKTTWFVWHGKTKNLSICFLITWTQISCHMLHADKKMAAPRMFVVRKWLMSTPNIADQNRMQYSTARKAKKWWKYLFWFLFDTAICNALVCMKESAYHQMKTKSGKSKKRAHIDFRMNLARQLVAGFMGSRKRHAPSNLDSEGTRHWPTKFPKRGRCVNCSKEGRHHKILIGCKKCQKHLCVDHNCFEKYHYQLWKN